MSHTLNGTRKLRGDNPKQTNPLRCYVCGESVLEEFCLATMSEETDRVFVLHNGCSDQVEGGTNIIRVSRSVAKGVEPVRDRSHVDDGSKKKKPNGKEISAP